MKLDKVGQSGANCCKMQGKVAKDGKVWQKVVKCCKVQNYSNFKNSLTYKPICSNYVSNMGQSGSK